MKKIRSFKLYAFVFILALLCCSCGRKELHEELPEEPQDSTPPIISGAADFSVYVGDSANYREGVSVTDDTDEHVELIIDADSVDLNTPGTYTVTYTAVDSSGNKAIKTIIVTVEEIPLPEEPEEPEANETEGTEEPGEEQPPTDETQETEQKEPEEKPQNSSKGGAKSAEDATIDDVNALCDKILKKITSGSMGKTAKAKAILKYVYGHVRYVGTSDKSDWVKGAYIGFTTGKGDCFNYYACSKALLTRAGIDNMDVRRVGGKTQHFWNLVYLDGQWYHFDACWEPSGRPHPHGGFKMTEAEVRAYTKKISGTRPNYYTYDYSNMSVLVAGTPESAYGEYTKLIERGIVAVDENGKGYIPSGDDTEKKEDEPSDKPSDKPADTPSDKPADTPSDTPSDKPADTPSDTPADESADTPSDTPADEPADTPADTPADEPADAPSDTPADEPADAPADTPADEPADTPADKPADTPADKPADTPADEPADTPDDTPADTPADEPADTPSDTPTDEPEEKDDKKKEDKPADAPSSIPADTPADNHEMKDDKAKSEDKPEGSAEPDNASGKSNKTSSETGN